jgi:glycosyltransferase involved in cell wall biosynthesis
MIKISACICSFNEELKLEDCLKSIENFVDEIVVVDSGSTDRTREIAQRYTERVIHRDWPGMTAQRAFSISQATHDWILVIDCDERLTPELAASIDRLRKQGPKHEGYDLPRRTYYVYRWLNHAWYPGWRTRVFDRRCAEVGGVDPHDVIVMKSGTSARLDGDLLHYSFVSLSDHLQTIDSFTTIAAKELIRRGKRVGVLDPFTHGITAFIKLYIFKRGFLDGFAGFSVALLSGVYGFVKYAKVLMAGWKQA